MTERKTGKLEFGCREDGGCGMEVEHDALGNLTFRAWDHEDRAQVWVSLSEEDEKKLRDMLLQKYVEDIEEERNAGGRT